MNKKGVLNKRTRDFACLSLPLLPRNRSTPDLAQMRIIPRNRSGQITIFIIIGIIVVSAIAVFFLFRSGLIPGIGGKLEKNPNAFLQSCIEPEVKEGIKIISIQGGYVNNPLNKAYKFEGENSPINISYLCYNQNDASLCVAQEPMLIQHLKEELYNYISKDVENCFNSLESGLEKQGYIIDATYNKFKVELTEGQIVIPITAEIALTKSGETSKYKDFKIVIPSKFYDLALVVQEIINSEAITGEFNQYNTFLYPEFNINKYRTADSSTIYTIKYKDSEEEFRFAVRGAVIPPGFGFKF